MKLTRLDRMEHIEDILQKKIQNAEEEIRSLGRMKDPEICALRMMYLMDLQQMRNILSGLRRKLDGEYQARRRERIFQEEARRMIIKTERGEDDEERDAGEVPGNGAGAETDEQPGMQERCGGGWTDGGIRHVQPDGAEPEGNDAGEKIRPRRRWQRWQIEAAASEGNRGAHATERHGAAEGYRYQRTP